MTYEEDVSERMESLDAKVRLARRKLDLTRQQGDLLSWTPKRASVEALEALPLKVVRDDHRKILAALASGPLTDAELLSATQIHPNAIRARRGELVTAGLVVVAGAKENESHRRVTLWKVRE